MEQNGRNELECSWGRKTPIINDLDFGWTDPDQVSQCRMVVNLTINANIYISRK